MLSRIVRTAAVAGALFATAPLIAPTAEAAVTVKYEEVIRSVFYLPSYVAIEKGFFRDEGIEVSLKTSWGSDKGTAALLSGNADVVLVGPETSVFINTGESPEKVKVFAGLTATDGSLLLAREKDDAFDWSKLKGKTIVSWRPGSMPALFLEHILRAHGLDPAKDVNIVTNITQTARLGAFLSGTGDYGTFFEPDVSRVVADGQGHALASVGRALGDVDYTVFVTTDTFIRENPDVVQGWTNAILRAQKYVAEADPTELAQMVSGYFPEVDVKLLADSIARYRELGMYKPDPLTRPEAIEKLQDLLVEGGLLKPESRVPYEAVVTPAFAEKAMATVK